MGKILKAFLKATSIVSTSGTIAILIVIMARINPSLTLVGTLTVLTLILTVMFADR